MVGAFDLVIVVRGPASPTSGQLPASSGQAHSPRRGRRQACLAFSRLHQCPRPSTRFAFLRFPEPSALRREMTPEKSLNELAPRVVRRTAGDVFARHFRCVPAIIAGLEPPRFFQRQWHFCRCRIPKLFRAPRIDPRWATVVEGGPPATRHESNEVRGAGPIATISRPSFGHDAAWQIERLWRGPPARDGSGEVYQSCREKRCAPPLHRIAETPLPLCLTALDPFRQRTGHHVFSLFPLGRRTASSGKAIFGVRGVQLKRLSMVAAKTARDRMYFGTVHPAS